MENERGTRDSKLTVDFVSGGPMTPRPPVPAHTPGPWRSVGDAMKVYAGEMCVCDIRGWGHLTGVGALHLPDEQAIEIQRANTALICAAPDLLAALKSAVEVIKTWHCIHDADETARDIYEQHAPEMKPILAAIAKAEGR